MGTEWDTSVLTSNSRITRTKIKVEIIVHLSVVAAVPALVVVVVLASASAPALVVVVVLASALAPVLVVVAVLALVVEATVEVLDLDIEEEEDQDQLNRQASILAEDPAV